jgi:hypothetical protein
MKRIGRIGSILLFVGLFAWGLPTTNAATAQSQYTLKECIDVALQKNVGIIQAKSSYQTASASLRPKAATGLQNMTCGMRGEMRFQRLQFRLAMALERTSDQLTCNSSIPIIRTRGANHTVPESIYP